MPHTFWSMIATTPWWIYLFFYCAIRVGLFTTKHRIINVKPLYFAAIPLPLFALIACYALPPSTQAILTAIPVLLAGALFGILRSKWQGIKALAQQQQLWLPGSWLFFFTVLLLFAGRQYIVFHFNLGLIEWMKLHGSDIILPLYAFSIGLMISQLLYFRYLLQNGPFVTQEELKSTA